MDCENQEFDKKLCNDVKWIENNDERIEALSQVISLTSEKEVGKNNSTVVYQNFRRLDFWNTLYQEKYGEGKSNKNFRNDFISASNKINDTTKARTRYDRWSKINKKLPVGSYLFCGVPISYWRLIHAKKFENIIDQWDQNDIDQN